MKFYPADWAASVRAMPLDARGAYLELLCFGWEHGGIPDDLDTLARIVGVGLDEFTPLWERWLRAKFTPDIDGLLVNAKQEGVRCGQQARLEQRREAGKGRWAGTTAEERSAAMREVRRAATSETTSEGRAKRREDSGLRAQGLLPQPGGGGDLLWRTVGNSIPTRLVPEIQQRISEWLAEYDEALVEVHLRAALERAQRGREPRALLVSILREDNPGALTATPALACHRPWNAAEYDVESAREIAESRERWQSEKKSQAAS